MIAILYRNKFRGDSYRLGGDFRDEAVTLADDSLDKARIPGIVTEDIAQLVDRRVNAVVGILLSMFAPKVAIDGVAPDELALAFEQQDEQLHRYALDFERMARAPELIALDV